MQTFKLTPLEIFASVWRNRQLIYQMAQRDILGRYRGSILGLFWSFFHPLFMLIVYTFIFSVVFKARWGGGGEESKALFALVLFSGLIVFNFFGECINRAPSLILSNSNYVKKAIFPLEILPWVNLCSSIFQSLVSLIAWLVCYIVMFGSPQLTLFWLPIIFVPLILFTMGLSWFFASLGTYLRDIGQIVGVATTALLFLTPIFYPLSAIPEKYRQIIYLNPLAVITENTRNVLIWGKLPDFGDLMLLTVTCGFVFVIGFAWFQKTRKGFADVV